MILRVRPLCELKKPTLRRVLELTKPDSIFHDRLKQAIVDDYSWWASYEDGVIATVVEDGELVGWARSERWLEYLPNAARDWDTLEAFVREDRRGEGIASLAATGLAVHGLKAWGDVAVFAPPMMLLARRAGLHPTLFAKANDEWVRA